jgi:hypothetical protein
MYFEESQEIRTMEVHNFLPEVISSRVPLGTIQKLRMYAQEYNLSRGGNLSISAAVRRLVLEGLKREEYQRRFEGHIGPLVRDDSRTKIYILEYKEKNNAAVDSATLSEDSTL